MSHAGGDVHIHEHGARKPYNAAPIGYCAFALTLFVFSMLMAGATVPVSSTPAVAMGLGLFYGGLIQFLAGLFELRIGNNFKALLFCSYSGYWFGLSTLYASQFFSGNLGTDISITYKGLGVYHLGWTIFTLFMLVACIRSNALLVVFFFFLLLTYILFTASYFLLWDPNLSRAGGAIGIVTSLILWYIGFASFMIKGDNSYFELPMFKLPTNTKTDLTGESAVEVRVQKP